MQRKGFDPIAEAGRKWIDHGWGDAADGMAVVTSIMRAQQIYQQRVDACLRPLDLTFARYELLMLLSFSRTGRLPMTTVSSRLQVHPTSVTNAADRLQRAGLVQREPHDRDRRITLVALTSEGRQLARRATHLLNDAVFENPGLTAKDAQTLVRLLASLRKNAGDMG